MAKKTTQSQAVGRNVTATIEGEKLTIVVDLSMKTEASMSGKTEIVATTKGNKKLADSDWTIGLNVYKYSQPKGKK